VRRAYSYVGTGASRSTSRAYHSDAMPDVWGTFSFVFSFFLFLKGSSLGTESASGPSRVYYDEYRKQ